MGVIDKTIHNIKCETCQIEESRKILDKGSGWGGSSWQSEVSFDDFVTIWSGGGKTEPEVVEAKCKKCGNSAVTESRFGGL